MIKYFSLFCFLVIVYSCSTSEVSDSADAELDTVIEWTIDFDNLSTQTEHFFKCIDSVVILPLSMDSTFMFGSVSKVACRDERIYVLDKSIAKALFVYDSDGKGLFKVGKQGRGPGEYVEITDFAITSSFIILFDAQSNKVLFFQLNGAYAFSKESRAEGLAVLNENLLVEYDGDSSWTINDIYGSVVYESMVNTLGIIWIFPPYFHHVGSDLLFLEKVSQTVFKVAPDGMLPYLRIHLGKYQVTDTYLEGFAGVPPNNLHVNFYQKTFLGRTYAVVDDYFENDTWSVCKLGHGGLPYMGFHRKGSSESYLLSPLLFKEKIDKGFSLLRWKPVSSYKDFFIASINYSELSVFIEEESVSTPLLKRLQQKLKGMNLTEETNPSLLFFKLKGA